MMEMFLSWVKPFFFFLLLGSASAFPPKHYTQHALFQRPPFAPSSPAKPSAPEPEPAQKQHVNTVSVTCHADSLEVRISADMFAVGAPVTGDELRLGAEEREDCRATEAEEDTLRIHVGLTECGTKHWMTEDSLVYTNLLIFSPSSSPSGVIRMDEAVIPIECHYQRKYGLSSSSLTPTWISFTSTQSAVENLEFSLSLMTADWLYRRSSNVFYLGDSINVEAAVRVGHHMKLRVFLSSCVATVTPDIHTEPKYIFLEDGCLLDSQISTSKSHFLSRTEDNKLQMSVDAFRFHEEEKGELYITCHMNAVPLDDAEAPNKACTLLNGRWRSADSNDFLCGFCPSEAGPSQQSSAGRYGPRGFGAAELESSWRSGLKSNKVWEQEARLGPVAVLPRTKSLPLPAEQLPPVLARISRPALYGSRWRGGATKTDQDKEVLPGPTSQDLEEEEEEDEEELEDSAPLEKSGPDFKVKSLLNATASSEPLGATQEETPLFKEEIPKK